MRPTGRRSGRGWPKSAGEPGALEASAGPRSAVGPAPRLAGTNPAEHHPRGRILVEAGGSATPSPCGRTGPGRAPPEGYRGGRRGWAPGLQGPGPWWLWAGAGETGRASGLRLVRGGVEGPGGLGGESREAPGARARASEGGRSLRGGGGCSLPGGRRGAPLERGGGEGVYRPCRAMSIHGHAAWDYIPNPPRRSPFLGGAEGGGGAGGCCVLPPSWGGGSPVGAPSGLAERTRWRPLGTWAPSRKNLGFAGGDSAIYYYTPLPLNLANKQQQQQQQQARHHSVLATAPSHRLGLDSTLAILEPRWWPCQIQVLSQKLTGGGPGRWRQVGRCPPKSAQFWAEKSHFSPKTALVRVQSSQSKANGSYTPHAP